MDVATVEHERRVAAFIEAQESVAPHLRLQAVAELEREAWMRRHRGVPVELLFDAATGEPLDPELATLDAAIAKAQADVRWCEALVIACGEAVKGCAFADVPNNRSASVMAAS